MRITIVGLPGSGKSTLAQKISKQKKIPHIHIDRFWLENGGGQNSRSTPNPEQVHACVRENVLKAIQADSWVSDGFYFKVQPEIADRANTVIFLDIPLWRRLLNHAERIISRKGRHQEVSFWGDLQFFFEMIGRDTTKAKKVADFKEKYYSKMVILKSRKEIEVYLKTLG